ncbi:hypothetical protein [Vibrio aestuarianus]|uniref:hypothetical protein n=1 Tax=Vibrio aestuarianus TaxID=28171 RepID=UPI00237CFF3D|nr:hypothetical protein [Vibrio aestuarianus]MDE1231332.1 hypothetical protein [Vibrio aestuarianus]MDE1349417.1 hypothetical protein [Vibrio aestuarianus]
MKPFLVFIYSVFLFSSVACANINSILEGQGYSEVFKDSFYQVYELGPNFNTDDYVFSYACGGGAICANIYDSQSKLFIDLPDNYIVDSEQEDFSLSFSKESSKLCISGESAYYSIIYNDVCYTYTAGELVRN